MKKVAIVGTAHASIHQLPQDDPSWEIWGCSAGNRGDKLRRVTSWFELHGVTDLKGQEYRGWVPEYFGWLNVQNFPVYMQEPNDLCPRAKVFPAKSLVKEFGRLPFTSSVAWMIAFAIVQGATEIGIFCVDMAATEEHYGGQKWGCLRMLEIAHQRGIAVTIPHESCLGQMPPLYGYAEATRMGRRLAVQEQIIRENITNLDATIARLTAERHMFAGGLDQIQYVRRTFVDGADADIDEEVTSRKEEDGAAAASSAAASLFAAQGPIEEIKVGTVVKDGTGIDWTVTKQGNGVTTWSDGHPTMGVHGNEATA